MELEPTNTSDGTGTARQSALFGTPGPRSPERSALPWVVAVAVVVVTLGLLLVLGRHKAVPANTVLPLDPYAANIVFKDPVASESTSLSGGKSTYLDGHVRNTGTRTLEGATLQVLFLNDEAMPPQVETLPLTLIRTREPYVDTQPLSAAPLGPGEDREFRLIFENIHSNWNQQLPQIHVVQAKLR